MGVFFESTLTLWPKIKHLNMSAYLFQDVLFFFIHTASKPQDADSISSGESNILSKLTQLMSYIHRILHPEARGYDCIILQNCFDKGSRILHILFYICKFSFTLCSKFWKQIPVLSEFIFILKA